MVRMLHVVAGICCLMLATAPLYSFQEAPRTNGDETAGQQTKSPSADEKPDRGGAEGRASVVDSPATLSTVTKQLSPENQRRLGQMLAEDWKERPEWADMLITLLKGEGMRMGTGWFKPSEKKYDWAWLAARFDANGDGAIGKDELPADTPLMARFFARLDRDADGKVRQPDFEHFTRQPLTPPSMMSQFLMEALDVDTNGRVTREELEDFMKRADGDRTGFLTTDDLFRNFLQEFEALNATPTDMPRPEQMLPMFFRGELGMLESGPSLGDEAIDFTLPTHDGTQTVTLSKSRGRPVVLIFGSFTCGPFRSQAGAIEKLYARYKDEVDFFAIYIRDAHPTDGWQMNVNERAGVLVEQPKTQQARHLVASNCARTLGLSMPMLVDTIDDRFNRAYSGFPDRLYLIDRGGKIIYKGGRGPMGYKPRELEQTLIMLLLDEHLARQGK